MGTAAWAALVSLMHRSALLGQSLAWRRPWSAGFELILVRVRRSWCCSRVGAAAAPASSPTSYYKQKTKVYKGSSAMPHLTS
jgi:hypothetical protein